MSEVVKSMRVGNNEADNLITLFGLTAEELLEAGATYEDVKGKSGFLE